MTPIQADLPVRKLDLYLTDEVLQIPINPSLATDGIQVAKIRSKPIEKALAELDMAGYK